MADAEPSPTPDAFRSHLIALVSAYQLGPTSGVPVPRYDGTRDWQTETILVCLSEFARRMWAAEETVVRLQKEARRRDRRRAKGKRNGQNGNGSIDDDSWDDICDSIDDSDSDEESVVLRGIPRHEYEPSLIKSNGHGGYGYGNGLSLRDVNRDHYYHNHSRASKNTNNLSPKPTVTTTTGAGGTFQVSCPTCGRCWIYPPSSTSATTGATPTVENVGAAENDSVLMGLLPPGPAIPAISDSGLSIEEENVWLRALVVDAARVCGAVSKGDLNQKITAPAKGSAMTNLKEIINVMVDKLGQFSDEVTRVSQEVGTEGKLGGQAVVMDVEGTWRQLTGVVNNLAANLTAQVRSIAKVTKAVALGDLSKQIEVEARGEILDLKNTVNGMVIRSVFFHSCWYQPASGSRSAQIASVGS